MHPAKKSQTAVWKSFIPVRTGICCNLVFTNVGYYEVYLVGGSKNFLQIQKYTPQDFGRIVIRKMFTFVHNR